MNKFKVLILLLLILFSTSAFAEQKLNFDAIKSKMIDVDINLTVPVLITSYTENNSFTFTTPVFSNQKSQIVSRDVYYLDSNGAKVPAIIEKDEYGNDVATFNIDPIDEYKYDFHINTNIKAENKIILPTTKYDLNNPITDNNEYLEPTKNIQSNRSEIISVANAIKTSNDAITEIVEITNWVHQNITYDTAYSEVVEDAVTVLSTRRGVCDEFANLTAALLRARGIPTRYVSGYANSTLSWDAHAWVEAYVPGYDWIPVDATYGEVGQVDASHIIISKSKDPDNIKDRLTTMSTVEIEFQEKIKSFNINTQKSYADYGYSDVLNINLISPEDMKTKSAFTIKANIKNTNANPLATLVILKTHDSFTQIYPRYSEEIVYLDAFQEKELIYHFILPDLDSPMYYSYILANQYKDVESSVNVYTNDGLYQEAFFVLPPIFYFKDDKLYLGMDIINHTTKTKTLKFDFNYCGIVSSESKVISIMQSNQPEVYIKSFDKIDSCGFDFIISGDYDYSKSIYVYPTQEIKVIEDLTDNNAISINDKNTDTNKLKDVWYDLNKMKVVEKSDSKGYIGYILLALFIIAIISFILIKPKKKIDNLTRV
ncbi:MAG: transglutaminase domain-containing protein [archaeon]